MPALKLSQARIARDAAREKVVAAEAKVQQLEEQIAAQQEAIAAAMVDLRRARFNRDREKRFESDVGGKSTRESSQTVKDLDFLVEKAEVGVRAEQKKLAALQAGRAEAESGVKLYRMDVEAKKIQEREAQKGVDECVVRAPYAGTPLRVHVSAGDVLGANPHQPAIEFAPNRPLLVRAEVEQEFVGRIHKGQAVTIADHVTGQECARGTVASIARWYAPRRSSSSQLMQLGNDVRTLECVIKIDSTAQELRIGQRVRVEFPQ